MKIIILGAGRRGIRLARHLVEEKKDVVILDEQPEETEKAMRSVDCLAITCNGTNTDDLKNAGVDGADAFIAITGSDETNLVSCGIVSSTFNVPLTIASVRNLSYTKTDKLMGITHIVNPFQEVAKHIHQEIEQGIYSDIISFENSELVLYNILVEKSSKFDGKILKNIKNDIPGRYIVAALCRGDQVVVPEGNTVIKTGDILSVVVSEDEVETLISAVGERRQKPKRIALVGGTKLTDFLLEEFSEKARKNITVIAKDKDACNNYSEHYPEALIINENIASEGLFRQEGLENYDLFVAITNNDELNIITSSYAKSIGIKNSMALITKSPDYLTMAKHLNIDSLISSQDVTADSIMKYLNGSNVSSLHSLFNGKIVAFEYKVDKTGKIANCLLKDINMRGLGIIAGIQKGNGENLIPNGLYCIEASDTLLIVAKRSSLETVQELLGI